VDDVRRQPTDFLRARLTALFLLSLGAVSGSILAWWPQRATSPLLLLWPPLVIGAAAFGGAAIYERLAAIDRQLRERVRAVAGVAYGTALLLISLALLLGHRKESENGVALLEGLQVAFLLLAGFGRGYLGTLINGLVLTASSMLAGGAGAALSAALLGGLVPIFLAADHASRKLTEYPVESLPRAGPILARGALEGLAISAALAVSFLLVPPAPYAPLRPSTGDVTIPPERIAGLLGNVIFVAVASAIAFYVALRWGGGSSSGEAEPTALLRVPARRRSQPLPGAAAGDAAPVGKPWSLRVVKLYVRTTEQLARLGRRRRRFQTPREFAATLAPAGAAGELADLFSRARYGLEDLTETDFERASKVSREILDHQRGRS
jgi:hypothetical protein